MQFGKLLLLSVLVLSPVVGDGSFSLFPKTAKKSVSYDPAPKYWEHFCEAGERYGIDPKLLLAIGMTESSLNRVAVNKANRNRTIDVGVMQINSCHFSMLSKYTDDLNNLYSPRFNIHVGAWVLNQCMDKFSGWKAVDCYNKGAGKAQTMSSYVKKVNKNFKSVYHKNFPDL